MYNVKNMEYVTNIAFGFEVALSVTRGEGIFLYQI